MGLELPIDWTPTNEEEEASLTQQLFRELPSNHPLKTKKVICIAHTQGRSDDVLVSFPEEKELYVVVHLTWSFKGEQEGFPTIEFSGSFHELKEWSKKALD